MKVRKTIYIENEDYIELKLLAVKNGNTISKQITKLIKEKYMKNQVSTTEIDDGFI